MKKFEMKKKKTLRKIITIQVFYLGNIPVFWEIKIEGENKEP